MCCPSCGKDVQAEARFCWNCGKRVIDSQFTHEAASLKSLPTQAETVMRAVRSGDSPHTNSGEHDSDGRSGADFRNLEQIAEWGDAQAQLELGRRYESGEGLTKDYRKAAEWYQHSADQGVQTLRSHSAICTRAVAV